MFEFEFKSDFAQKLRRQRDAVQKSEAAAAKRMGQRILDEAEVPIDTGELESSGEVVQENGVTKVRYTADHAAIVHDDNRFLARAIQRHGRRFPEDLAQELRRRL